MSDISENISLPPGWDTKYDFRTGKRYYINYFTKHTSLEDPRMKYKKLQNGDSFGFQSYQSSPARSYSPQPLYHMHQDINLSSGRPSPIMGRSYSPLMGSNAIHYLAQKPHEYPTVESSVAKIKALFPTVSETHIKTLLHKYHYREAVVMSALQVEKHPLTTPGPYSSPLAAARHVIAQIAPSAPGSPGRFSFTSALRNLSPKRTPHSSPKMKLRYLKSVFPVVEETVLLDTLCSSENNVHKATEKLMTMGFIKKIDQSSKIAKKEEAYSVEKESKSDCVYIPLRDPSPKLKSYEEKAKMKKKLESKFEKIAERIITLALETAEYDEERAEQFLASTLSEEIKSESNELIPSKKDVTESKVASPDDKDVLEKPFRDSGIWEKTSPDSVDTKTTIETTTPSPNESVKMKNLAAESTQSEKIPDTAPVEPKPVPIREATLMLASNLCTQSKTGIKLCSKLIPRGANKTLLGSRRTPKGANHELYKGPCKGLAKGSKFAEKNGVPKIREKDAHQGECTII